MRIGLVSGTLYPTPNGNLDSRESLNWLIAEVLGRLGHEVHLFATPRSRPPARGFLHYIPTMAPALSRELEDFTYQHPRYWQVLKSCDVVHDGSILQQVAERLHYMEHDQPPHVSLYNEVEFACPRAGSRHNAIVTCGALKTAGVWDQERTHNSAFPEEGNQTGGTLGNALLASTKVLHLGIDVAQHSMPDRRGDYILFLRDTIHPLEGLQAVLTVAASYPETPVVIARLSDSEHDVEYEKTLAAMLAAANVGNVTFAKQQDPDELLRNAAVYLAPTGYTCGFSLLGLKAMAYGVPIVASWWGAWPDMVVPQQNGFLCLTEQDYVEAIMLARELDPLGCRRIAEERFSTDLMGRHLVAIYEEAAQGGRW